MTTAGGTLPAMLDAAEIAAFLSQYVAEGDLAGVNPLPVRELAALLEMVAGTGPEPSTAPYSELGE